MLKPRWEKDAVEDAAGFRGAVVKWFMAEGLDFPWRRTRDPYAVLVSEVMLQQTQIATVLGRGYYARFLDRFPDLPTLAAAGDEELLKAWEGLGYYRRARFLREAARAVMERHGGVFPSKPSEILALPGVGRYTAGAVASFAFGQAEPIVDGNIARVLMRLMDCEDPVDGRGMARAWEWAEVLVDPKHPREFNSGLMELGQRLCRPGVPDCLSCPVSRWCRTREPAGLPIKAKRHEVTEVAETLLFAERDGKVLLRQLGAGRREGMWRLPEREPSGPLLYQAKYGITRYRVTMAVHGSQKPVRAGDGEAWQELEKLKDLVIPPADRRALDELLGSSG
ncbi:MAG: A/G-specific adenine glycosylase [Akkermansiaceae bacterium]|nr:A/G-specific adenine glycosylase [Akkermansiaceae bacterium]